MRASSRAVVASIVLLSFEGCHRDKPPPVDPLAIPSSVPELALPTSLATAHPSPALKIYVTRRELFVESKSVAKLPADPERGFDASLKGSGSRNDLFVVPLYNAVTSGKDALLYLDRDTPYRIINEVLYTLGQSNVDHWYIATTGAASIAAQDVKAPDPCAFQPALQLQMLESLHLGDVFADAGMLVTPTDAAPSPPPPPPPPAPTVSSRPCPPTDWTKPRLNATVIVVETGFSVKARAGNIAPGCKEVGAGLAVPLANGKYDFKGLTACLRNIKEAAPEFAGETSIILTANPATTAQVIVDTMDATRGGDAGVLFTDVMFGLAR